MRPSRPFVLVGDHALQVLRARTQDALNRWLVQWAPPGARASTQVTVAHHPAATPASHFTDGTGHVWLTAPGRANIARLTLGAALSQVASRPQDWASDVVEAAQLALQRSLVEALLVDTAEPLAISPPDTSLFVPGSGGVMLECEALSLRAWACSAVLRHVPPSTAPRAPLAAPRPMSHALANQGIRLAVSAGSVELELGRLLDLQAGDVICLPTQLHEPMWIETPSGERLATCALGQQAGRRAVRLLADQ